MTEGAAAPAPAAPAAPALSPTPQNFRASIAAKVAAAPPPAPAPAPAALAATAAPAAELGGTEQAFNKLLLNNGQNNEPANQNAEPQTAEQQLQTEQPSAGDPWAEVLHESGVSVKDAIDALKRGEMPEALLDHLKTTVNPNGNPIQVSLREAGKGYMRISDYTRQKQELVALQGDTENRIGKVRELFNGWQTPDGLEQGLERMALMPTVRQIVTKNWGTAEKPNVQGFVDDMRRLGMWQVFQHAVGHEASRWEQRAQRYGWNRQDPAAMARAEQMISEDERSQEELWKARLEAETERNNAKKTTWEVQQQQLLAQRQQQPDPQAQQAELRQIHDLKTSAFGVLGIPAHPIADQYFAQNFIALANMAKQAGQQLPQTELVAQAVQATYEQLGDDREKLPGAKPGVGLARPAANGNAQPQLGARPAGAPTSQASQLPRSGSLTDFRERMAKLKGQR